MAFLAFAVVMTLSLGCSKAAPEAGARGLEVLDADGLRSLAKDGGKPLLVSLWATWCEPCLEEMAPLGRFQAAHPEVVVIGLVTDDPDMTGMAARIDKVLSDRKPSYRQGRIPPGGEDKLLSALGSEWDGLLPKLVIVMPDGRARVRSGAVDDDDLRAIVPELTGAW